jgi:hypothetical protein
MKIRTIYTRITADDEKTYEKVKDTYVLTVQDPIVSVPGLLKLYEGRLDELFKKFNNKLLYESELGGVFIDQLNPKEVEEYNRRLAEHEAKKAELENEEKLFKQWKAEKAAEVNRRSHEPASKPEPKPESKPDSET